MADSITQQLVAIENEQRAQKVAKVLNYGQLKTPESAPIKNWSGHLGYSTREDGIVARWVATFIRTDGVNLTPRVDFAYDWQQNTGYYDAMVSAGNFQSYNVKDKFGWDEYNYSDGLYDTTSNSVSWYIDLAGQFDVWGTGADININVQAISAVPGILTLERII